MWTTETLLEVMKPMKLAIQTMVPVSFCCQIRAWTPDGEWQLYFSLPDDLTERPVKQQAIRNWLRYKQASAVTVLTRIPKPLGVMVVGLKRVDGEIECKAVVDWCERYGNTMVFSGPEWLTRADIEDDIVDLLPVRGLNIDRQAREMLADESLRGHGVEIRKVGEISPIRARLKNRRPSSLL